MLKLLIITPNWPAPNHSAVGVRLMQIIDFFKRQGYLITIASTADNSHLDPSHFDGITLVPIRLNHSSFDGFVQELNPEIVVFDRFMTEEQFGWRVAENAPDALRILDTEDLHSLRKSREEALKNGVAWQKPLWQKHDTTKREVASILRCDLSLIISSFEMKLLKSVVPNFDSLLLNLPFMAKPMTEADSAKWPSFEERVDFVFIGFGGHAPNVDAIEYLHREIWPLIRSGLPEVNVHVYGGNLPKKIHQMNNKKEGFLVHGWAENADEVISKAKVMLAPLRYGAGQKGKLVNAMRCGTPAITTSIGAEGMHNELEWNGKIGDDPKVFSDAAIEYYKDSKKWKDAQKNGLRILKEIFDKNRAEVDLKSRLETVQTNLKRHRKNNFIGELLQHQSMAATKYMGKWIEEKSRG